MSTKTLRSLAKDHANGVLDKSTYRKARDQLLDGVLTGKIRVKSIDFRPPVDIQDLDATMERERTQIRNIPPQKQSSTPEPTPTSTSTQKPIPAAETPSEQHFKNTVPGFPITLILIITIILAVISLIIILTLPYKSDETVSMNTQNTDNISANEEWNAREAVIEKTSAGERLITDFLAQNDWSEDNLQQFKSDWLSLSAEELTDGLASPLKGQLANAIYQQLLEERALLSLGDTATVISRQNTLVKFASDLGIEDPRLQVEGVE
jgi:hypothetical protein